jgi:hypothetical protein
MAQYSHRVVLLLGVAVPSCPGLGEAGTKAEMDNRRHNHSLRICALKHLVSRIGLTVAGSNNLSHQHEFLCHQSGLRESSGRHTCGGRARS